VQIPSAIRPRVVAGAAVALLALVETAVAVIAPTRAPKPEDWAAAAREVRGGFAPGDLIVAAPAWADPILRVHLGDLIPAEVAGRLDDERFGRVWEVSQRGARAAAADRGSVALERHFGALTVRRIERPPEVVSYDFVARWADARVTRREASGAVVPCAPAGDRFQCPNGVNGFVSVRRQIAEVDTRLREAFVAPPVRDGTVVVEFPSVPLGRTLVIATGLHNVWQRKEAQGSVTLRVVVADRVDTTFTTLNEDGWSPRRIDTSALAGQTAPVRFEVTAPDPHARLFAIAAEARR
jgi:hypothetical protein